MADEKKPYISKSYLITQFKNFKKYIDGIFLPQINPSVTGNLKLDGELVDKDGNSMIQTFENKDTLDGFSENSEGGLIWNGAPIEGGGGGASDAIDVAYDNATSELVAENVQEAIDELDKYVDDNKLDYRVEERKLIVGGGLGQKHAYSTEEQVVGTWIDGKAIYEKTYNIENTVVVNVQVWTNVLNIDVPIDKLLSTNVFDPNYVANMILIKYQNGYLTILSPITLGINAGSSITIRYTKTTD